MKVVLIDEPDLITRVKMTSDGRIYFLATYWKMLVSSLRRLYLTPDDIIIIAQSDNKSWRSDYEDLHRKKQRQWKLAFASSDFADQIKVLHSASPFHILLQEYMEAEDLIAYACDYFKDNEIIIVSSRDKFKMLASYSHVKLFSPRTKRFIEWIKPYKHLAKALSEAEGETFQNEKLNIAEFEKTRKIADLINQPQEVKEILEEVFKRIDINKPFNIELLRPYMRKSLALMYNEPKKPNRIKDKKKEQFSLI